MRAKYMSISAYVKMDLARSLAPDAETSRTVERNFRS